MKQFLFGLIIIFFFVEHSLSSEIISGIEDNWNKIKSMSGEFEQIDSDGKVSNGNFFFSEAFSF